MRRWPRAIVILVALGIVALGWGGWRMWERLRPPSAARWTAAVRQARGALAAEQYRRAQHHVAAALAEAQKMGAAEAQRAETLTVQGDLWLAARLFSKTQPPPPRKRSFPAVLAYARVKGEYNFGKRIAVAQIDAAYQQAVSTYEQAHAARDTQLALVYRQFIRKFQQVGNHRVMLRMAAKWQAAEARMHGELSPALLPIIEEVIAAHNTAGDPGGTLPYRAQAYRIVRQSYGLLDPRTSDAYRQYAHAALYLQHYALATDIIRLRIEELSAAQSPEKSLIVPYADLGRALGLHGQQREAEQAFRRAIRACDRVHTKRFFAYPMASMGRLPEDMEYLYDQYCHFLQRMGRHDEAQRIAEILTD